jgi:hypothetical protein
MHFVFENISSAVLLLVLRLRLAGSGIRREKMAIEELRVLTLHVTILNAEWKGAWFGKRK